MKKRLSDGFIPPQALTTLGLLAVFCPLIFMIRVITMGGIYTRVPVSIPVMPSPIKDQSLASFREETRKAVDKTTLGIALTPTEFIFGDLAAFTSARTDIRNKFIVPHAEGSPQVDTLLKQYEDWQADRIRRLGIRGDGLAVLIPDQRVPINIVVRVVDILNRSQKFERVVLAGGLL